MVVRVSTQHEKRAASSFMRAGLSISGVIRGAQLARARDWGANPKFFPGRMGWMLAAALVLAAMLSNPASAQTFTTLVSFDYNNGGTPYAGLIADANGNLFGTTFEGGAYGLGTVFEVVKTNGVYASTPTILVSFDGDNNGSSITVLET